MSSAIFDQLTGPFKDVITNIPLFEKMVKYGIMADIDFKVETDHVSEFKRRNGLFTNVVMPFGKLKLELMRDNSNFDGFNSKVINEYGTLDITLINELLKMSGRFRASVSTSLAAELAGESLENHSGVLFNLIRMKVYAEVDKKKLNYKNNDVMYDDGHVNQTCKQFLGEGFDEEIKLEYNEYLPVVGYSENTIMSVDDYCVNLTGFTSKDFSILCMAIGGWKTDCPIRLFSGSPQLAARVVTSNNFTARANYDIVDFTAREVDVVLKKLIMNNRLAAQFDLAYAMVVMAMYTPLPRAVEANAWVSPTHTFAIPRAGSVRGLIPEFLLGTPYNPRPASGITWEN